MILLFFGVQLNIEGFEGGWFIYGVNLIQTM